MSTIPNPDQMAYTILVGITRRGNESTWPCSAPPAWSPVSCRSGPRARPILTAGFVYIGPREDWGWNQSFAVAAAALKGVPNVRVVQAGYLPESTDYGSGKDDAGDQSLHQGDGGLDRRLAPA